MIDLSCLVINAKGRKVAHSTGADVVFIAPIIEFDVNARIVVTPHPHWRWQISWGHSDV